MEGKSHGKERRILLFPVRPAFIDKFPRRRDLPLARHQRRYRPNGVESPMLTPTPPAKSWRAFGSHCGLRLPERRDFGGGEDPLVFSAPHEASGGQAGTEAPPEASPRDRGSLREEKAAESLPKAPGTFREEAPTRDFSVYPSSSGWLLRPEAPGELCHSPKMFFHDDPPRSGMKIKKLLRRTRDTRKAQEPGPLRS